MKLSEKVMANHLKQGYSDFVLDFISNHREELFLHYKILDAGAGHYRNLNLFHMLGFKELYAIDKNTTSNPLNVPVTFLQHDLMDGIPYPDNHFEVTLCNYVLMFISSDKIEFVLEELVRVTNKFLVIETNRLKVSSKETHFKDYSFQLIIDMLNNYGCFDIIRLRNGSRREKVLLKKKTNAFNNGPLS